MSDKLVLDFGNTLKKAAVFRDNHLLDLRTSKKDIIEIIEDYKLEYPNITKAILSSVINIDDYLMNYLKDHFKFIFFNQHTLIPIINKYKTPKTLGKDRLAAVIGAYMLTPKKNILIIDAGSSITYELINEEGEYLGGAISPGLNMRARALETFTDKLPLVEPSVVTPLVGRNTKESIKSGLVNACLAEIQGMIYEFQAQYKELNIFLTGGDAYYFEKRLKNNIFASENLVLKGLNYILDFNEL